MMIPIPITSIKIVMKIKIRDAFDPLRDNLEIN
jgi:hypothetical protein